MNAVFFGLAKSPVKIAGYREAIPRAMYFCNF